MEKIEIIELFVKVVDELIGVKFYKVMLDEAGVKPYYEFQLQKFFQAKGDAEVKRCGGTFVGADMNTLLFRLIAYVQELNQRGVEKSEINDKY